MIARTLKTLIALAAAALVPAASFADDAGTVTRERLRASSGVTLQWIGWERRGEVAVREVDGELFLTASQVDPAGPGTLWLDGKVVEAGPDYFILEGLIRIANSPDGGRMCEANRRWRFAITQNRRYYRLREFEWCDGLTDYVDIYF